MITQQFDVKIATFQTLDAVIPEEVDQADIVSIAGFVEGGIYHSQQAQWINNLVGVETPENVIRSKKERKAVKENRNILLQQGYQFEVRQMTEEDFTEFRELYEATTMLQPRAIRYSLETAILGRIMAGVPVFCAGMYKDSKLESGLAFSMKGEYASVSYGAKKKFTELRGGVGGVLEYELLKYCFENNLQYIDHGKSSNPAGFLNRSGLFEFKARYGNSAFPAGRWMTSFVKNPEIAHKDLIYVGTVDNKIGYIVISEKNPEEATKAYRTREVRTVQTYSFSECKDMFKKAFPDS